MPDQHEYVPTGSIYPAILSNYLTAKGWTPLTAAPGQDQTWTIGADTPTVTIPTGPQDAQYQEKSNQAIRTLGAVYGDRREEVLQDVTAHGYDIIQVENPRYTGNVTAPVNNALNTLRESRALMRAAATSALRTVTALTRRPPEQVEEYTSNLHAAHNPANAMQVNLLAPIILHFTREVTLKLASGLQELTRPSTTDHLERAKLGVSANLCTALTNILDDPHNDTVDITIRWARSKPHPTEKDTFRFTKESQAQLRAIAAHLQTIPKK